MADLNYKAEDSVYKVKEIGGYMELELPRKESYYYGADVVEVNTGRAAIYHAIKASKAKKLYLPHYLCTSMLQVIEPLNLEFEFYNIDENFMPIFDRQTTEDEAFLYINYFGTASKNTIKKLKNCHKNFLMDNTQAFFAKPIKGAYNLYSARKFFGVNDGGYLIKDGIQKIDLESDLSYPHAIHLLKRIEEGANTAYFDNMKNEDRFDDFNPIGMSKLSKRILESIDYEEVKLKRQRNFYYLHSKLKDLNKLNLEHSFEAPMVYPMLIEHKDLRAYLVSKKIYVPHWWKDVLSRVESNSFEHYLSTYLLALPIDQRYDLEDMDYIVGHIKAFDNSILL